MASAGDNLTAVPFTRFSVTKFVRSLVIDHDPTNPCSGAYVSGGWVGSGVTVALSVGGGIKAAGTAVKGVTELSHWIPARLGRSLGGPVGEFIESNNILNGNYVSKVRHYLHDPNSFPRLKDGINWRDLGPKWNPVLSQLDRLPNVWKGTAAGTALAAVRRGTVTTCPGN